MTIVWSIAGTDSGGGAGLSADQRAADAFGVHLCPVVAAVTAQHSRAVRHVEAMPVELLDAQLQALAEDMPPRVIKTGLLGGPAQLACVARWVDRLRREQDVALVVDPVLGSSTGASFADAAMLQAYRDELLPRATAVTPNLREARRLVAGAGVDDDAPALARALQQLGPSTVCITGGDEPSQDGRVRDWLASPQASGWLAAPRIATEHTHGTGCTFATSMTAALALGFPPADAAVLAKMATAGALRHGYEAGGGAGPVRADAGFIVDPLLMPTLSWDETLDEAPPADQRTLAPPGLYAIVDSAERVERVLAASIRTLQLRIKTPSTPDAAWQARLQEQLRHSIQACRSAGATLFINDHWALAIELGADGVHLGQEDLAALGPTGRTALRASGLALGISSHSLWELARARSLAPRYIACGPVWPTLTKAMPWRAQGLDNLAWWCAMAGAPVVAIGGILSPAHVEQAAQCGADGVCLVRVLGDDPVLTLPDLSDAWQRGRALPVSPVGWPHPSLSAAEGRCPAG